MRDYEDYDGPTHEPVSPYYRAWTITRGKRTRNWLDCLCDRKGGSSRYGGWWDRNPNKRRTLRSYRDGSAARYSRQRRGAKWEHIVSG